MARINHPSYHKFSHHIEYYKQVAFKQSYDNSCGAACLLCAALELGLTQMPQMPKTMIAGYTFLKARAPIGLALNHICEGMIYQITSDSPDTGDSKKWGYSMPSKMVLCAQMLGLKAYVSMKETLYTKLLKIRYRSDVAKLNSMNVLLSPNRIDSLKAANPNYIELKILVQLRAFALHYVLVRPDGSSWDPADGEFYESIRDLKDSYSSAKVHGIGLSIILFR